MTIRASSSIDMVGIRNDQARLSSTSPAEPGNKFPIIPGRNPNYVFIWYAMNWSLWHDIAIPCKTFPALIRRQGH